MPTNEASRSPARRPQLVDRTASSQSLSKGSPTAGPLSKSHKGSATRLHKTHTVSHTRHPHGRVPSHGKGLNKLSKLGPGNPTEDGGGARNVRSESDTPPTSPAASNVRRNSSNMSLPKVSSKATIKRNASHGSTAKLGNQQKTEKVQTKAKLNKMVTNRSQAGGPAKFELGDEDQDEDWTEESSSLSPTTTRNESRPKAPISRDPPSPDDPPDRSSHNLPHSPPESPHSDEAAPKLHNEKIRHKDEAQHKGSPYSHPPDAELVIHRLLNRSGQHTPVPTTSNVSASITPPVNVGSPSLNPSSGATLINEPSMPADGISRFLTSTSNSGSGTPFSVSHLQSNLLNHDNRRSPTPTNTFPPHTKTESRRVKSATNLGRRPSIPNSATISLEENSTSTPPTRLHPSPFESARAADPTAGKSFTQLKLDLQRLSTQQDTPSSTHPLIHQGGLLNMSTALSSSDMAARLRRQYAEAKNDVRGGRKFYPELVTRELPRQIRGGEEWGTGSTKAVHTSSPTHTRGRGSVGKLGSSAGGGSVKSGKSVGSESGGRAGSLGSEDGGGGSLVQGQGQGHGRGRVRFEVGGARRSLEDGGGEVEGDGDEGLLRRMWVVPGMREEEVGD